MSKLSSNIELQERKIALQVIDQELKGLSALKEVIDENFIDVIDLLANVKGRIIITGVGKSGHIAKKFVATLASTGSPSLFIHPSEASHGDMGMITEDDIVILLSNSGQTIELNHIIDYCKRFAIKTIGICRNSESQLIKITDFNLVIPNIPEACNISAPTTSSTMMIALGDAIAVVLYERKGFTDSDYKLLHPGGHIGAKLIKVYELMHKGDELPLVDDRSFAFDALIEMSNKRLGCIGVIDKNLKLIGVLTDGDIRRHIDCDFRHTKITDIMSLNPLTISSEMFASEALKIMNDKSITNLFVIDKMDLVGVIHMHDILKAKVA